MKTISIIPILAISIMVGGCEVMQDIDKGLYQVSEKAAPRDRVTGVRTLNLNSRAEEIKKGNEPIEKLIIELKNKGLTQITILDDV